MLLRADPSGTLTHHHRRHGLVPAPHFPEPAVISPTTHRRNALRGAEGLPSREERQEVKAVFAIARGYLDAEEGFA